MKCSIVFMNEMVFTSEFYTSFSNFPPFMPSLMFRLRSTRLASSVPFLLSSNFLHSNFSDRLFPSFFVWIFLSLIVAMLRLPPCELVHYCSSCTSFQFHFGRFHVTRNGFLQHSFASFLIFRLPQFSFSRSVFLCLQEHSLRYYSPYYLSHFPFAPSRPPLPFPPASPVFPLNFRQILSKNYLMHNAACR